MSRTYDEWKTTEPVDDYANEQEWLEREEERERDEHPERYVTVGTDRIQRLYCGDCGAEIGIDDQHECAQMRKANRRRR